MKNADLEQRAERVRTIVALLHGNVLADDTTMVEIPADVMGAALSLFSQGGIAATLRNQTTRLAPRRITSMAGHTVVCPDDMVTTAYYRFSIDLQPRRSTVAAAPGPQHITAPTRPATALG